MKRVLMALLTVAMVGGMLSACETVKGFGKDMQNAGEAMQRSIK